jgi:phage repressor protein C with HTH and peptisase S24 domain/DNA-binding transcriptional regulator YiaG
MSGRSSWRDTPESRSTSSTRSTGHRRHWLIASGLMPKATASLVRPPASLIADLSAASLMEARISTTYAVAQGGLSLRFNKAALSDRPMSKELGDALRDARMAMGLDIIDVAKALEISGSAVSQWESGKTEPGSYNFRRVCTLLEIPPTKLVHLLGKPANPGIMTNANTTLYPEHIESHKSFRGGMLTDLQPQPKMTATPSKLPSVYAADIPVYGITVAGDDNVEADFSFNGQEIDLAPRPSGLLNKKDIFALYVANNSMYPAWKEGALIYISPHRPPSIGDDVIIELHNMAGEDYSRAYLKRLVSRGPKTIKVEQFNPNKELEFTRSDIKRLLRVVPYEEAIGLTS